MTVIRPFNLLLRASVCLQFIDMAAHKSLDVLIHYFDQNKNPKKKREERRKAKRARSLVDVDVIRIYPRLGKSHVLYALQLTLHFSASVQKQRKSA